ncbi:hypothetical protein [Streptomyces sp. t39]|uniref:hypothetical protein n=1 Tax=Streptomyces sp. t39 TaxID=1828156 RepID=UPI0021CAA7DB|nr:hypothetical protein [Streptomyces sp. t39]
MVHQVEPVRRNQPSVPFVAVAWAHVLRSLRRLGLRMSKISRRDAVHEAVARGGPAAYAVRHDRLERTWP